MWIVATASALGLLTGLRHAFEPDHLAAISTLVSERSSQKRATWVGLAWGLGHALPLIALGGTLLVLRITLSPRTATMFEALVALMLVALGIRALLLA